MARGSLSVVGTGFLVAGQTTPEALSLIRGAERLLLLVAEPATRIWLESQNPTARSLGDSFWEGRPRRESYEEVVERILEPVRAGQRVCAAFYGHPGVFVHSSHEAVRRARAEGLAATMLPGVSAEDCLYADLGVDPALHGCQSFEATDWLLRHRPVDPTAALVLWQIGALGTTTYSTRSVWNPDALPVLVEALRRTYPADHRVVVYEATQYPVCGPLIQELPLVDLPRAQVSTYSTLYVPPLREAALDREMLERLGFGGGPRPRWGLGGAPAAAVSPVAPAARVTAGGSLTVVGTGYRVAGQVTPESRVAMERADRLLYLVTDPATSAWLRALNPSAESLHDCYREGEDGAAAADRMVARILAPLREGRRVCAAFSGHPGILVHAARLALEAARSEGFPAGMLPAVSCEDCLFADLGFDPAVPGRLLFDASDFLLRPRELDPTAALVLLQAGAAGLHRYRSGREPDRAGLAALAEVLGRRYPADHPVVLYEADPLPPFEPRITRLALADLPAAPASVVSTLLVTPQWPRPLDGALLERLRRAAGELTPEARAV